MAARITITPLIIFALTPIFIWLSLQVVKQRRIHHIAVGDGNAPALERAIGVHNNFAQYVPFTVLSLLILELNQAPHLLLFGLGFWLVFARGVHAYGVSQSHENFKFRRFGVFGTLCVILISSIANLYYVAKPLFH